MYVWLLKVYYHQLCLSFLLGPSGPQPLELSLYDRELRLLGTVPPASGRDGLPGTIRTGAHKTAVVISHCLASLPLRPHV